jgi:ABC-type branched-subunit amino acid transport system substrate-binding protein
MNTKNAGISILIILFIAACAWSGYTIIHANTPVRIGVLLPVTGDVELKEPLEWAKENINRQGGIGGRPVELVYKDTGSGDTTKLAQELLDDDSIRIVIGPPSSDDVYSLAPAFIKKEKILISPLATSGDIIRAFGKTGYFWRTPQGDVAQVKTIVTLLKANGAKRVALLTENSTYGKTFYDWTGFFTTEYGLELTTIREFEPGSTTLSSDVDEALRANPDYIIAA